MPMKEDIDDSQDKSNGELGREALWFVLHTFIALAVLVVVLFAGLLLHPDPDAAIPKLIGTVLAFLLPMVVGFAVARKTNYIARHVWISGVLIFVVACVWAVDLPTGPGLCEQCGPGHLGERLWRTFFDVSNGSGLMGGNGLLIGIWVPLALFGYALGAKLSLNR